MKKGEIEIKLPKSVINFLNYCRDIRELSEDTISGYENDLKLFIKFLKLNRNQNNRKAIDDKYMETIELKHLHEFMTFLKEECGNKAKTRTRKVATLKSYFGYLQNVARIITFNPAYDLRSPKSPKRNPIYLTLEESQKLLNAVSTDVLNKERNECIITLFLHTGMRVSELSNMKFNSIKGDILTITGKGNKERTIYLNDSCLKVIDDYLKVRDNYNINDGRMFNIKKQRIEIIVKKYSNKTDIENNDKITPHKLRHTCATLMRKYGNADISELKEILGHENISTTSIYTHVDNEDLRTAVKNNPLNNL